MTLKRDIFIYVGLFFLVLGVFVSVTVPSLFHILAAIPLLLHFFKNFSEIKLPKSSIFLILLVFWGYISNFANFNDLNDVMRSFGKQKYIIFSILSLIAFPYFFKNYMTQKRIAFLIKTFFFTVIAACIVGIIKSRFGFDLVKFKSIVAIGRSEGFTEIMRYGYGTGFVVSLLTGALLYKSKVKNFISYKWLALAFVFGAVGMLESKCRGAILGTFCSIPFILYFKNKKLGVISFIVAFVSVLSIAAVVIFGGSSKSRMFQKLASPSNLIRFSQYHTATIAINENPLLGVGVNQFSSECPEIKTRHDIFWPNYCQKFNLDCDDYSHRKPYCSHAHNIFLQTGADVGIIGLLAFTLWLIFWLIEMFKRRDLWGYLVIPFIINLMIAGQFEYTFDANNSFMIFLLYPLSYLKKEHLNFSLDTTE